MSLALLLTVVVVVVLTTYVLGVRLVAQRTRDPAIVVSLLLIGYWTLVGALPLLVAKTSSPAGEYSYLEARLFPIVIDLNYTTTTVLYSLYLLAALVVVAFIARTSTSADQLLLARRVQQFNAAFSHRLFFVGIAIGIVLKAALIVVMVRQMPGASLYEATRTSQIGSGQTVVLYQYLNIATSYATAVAAAMWISSLRTDPWADGTRQRRITLAYALALSVLFVENALLGNRAVPFIMLGTLVVGWLRWRYLVSPRPERRRMGRQLALVTAAGMFFIGTIGISRGGELSSPTAVMRSIGQNARDVGSVFVQEVRSSEKLSAHMSLYRMIQDSDGLASPFLPNTYARYAQVIGAPSDQVFTLHYVTGWTMWIGRFGVLAAIAATGVLIGLVQRLGSRRTSLGVVPFMLAAATVPAVALPVILIRGGPENLRAAVVETVVIPALVLLPCYLLGDRTRSHAARRRELTAT